MPLAKNFRQSKTLPMLVSLGLVIVVGLIDYRTGFELNFNAFYLIPIILAVWFIGRGFGFFISLLCVTVSVVGDLIAGLRYSSSFALIWNSLISGASYFA